MLDLDMEVQAAVRAKLLATILIRADEAFVDFKSRSPAVSPSFVVWRACI